MRTAITIGRKDKDWVILSGPDVPADQQRAAFGNIGLKWPKDVEEVRFQMNDGSAKTKNKTKAEASVENMKIAHAKADKKAALAKEIEKDAETAAAKAKDDAVKQAESARVAAIEAKDKSKRPTFQTHK